MKYSMLGFVFLISFSLMGMKRSGTMLSRVVGKPDTKAFKLLGVPLKRLAIESPKKICFLPEPNEISKQEKRKHEGRSLGRMWSLVGSVWFAGGAFVLAKTSGQLGIIELLALKCFVGGAPGISFAPAFTLHNYVMKELKTPRDCQEKAHRLCNKAYALFDKRFHVEEGIAKRMISKASNLNSRLPKDDALYGLVLGVIRTYHEDKQMLLARLQSNRFMYEEVLKQIEKISTLDPYIVGDDLKPLKNACIEMNYTTSAALRLLYQKWPFEDDLSNS